MAEDATEQSAVENLPRSIFVPSDDPHKDLRETVNSVLSDRFMAFLSVVLIPIILIPFFVNLSNTTQDFFDICDISVIVLFVAEYSSKLYLAKSRWDYFRSPWHLLDLAVVLLSFVSYLPILGFGTGGSATLLVRLLRLPRALAVGGRTAATRIKSKPPAVVQPEAPLPTVIRLVDADLKTEHDELSWDELGKHLTNKKQEWIDVHNITEEGILELSKLLRIPPHHFKAKHVDDVLPHIDYVQEMSFVFLQSGEIKYPETSESYFTIARRGQVIVCRGQKVISASPHGRDLFKEEFADIQSHMNNHGFVASVLFGILDATLKQYRSVFLEIDREVSMISSTPRSKLPGDFLQRMYELQKQVTRLVSNMVHFKDLLGVIIKRRIPLEGFGEGAEGDFQDLLDQTSYLSDVAEDVLEHLKTIIELYINRSSFETNRVLKILAVLTALSIIPTAVGGILGMNLAGTPFAFGIWEVVVAMILTMAFIGYCFVKLGWLRP